MNKPNMLPTLPMPDATPAATTPTAVIHQPAPVNQVANRPLPAPVLPARPTASSSPYVDPYLFETGYYASLAEYQELTRMSPIRLQLRADVENARSKRRK